MKKHIKIIAIIAIIFLLLLMALLLIFNLRRNNLIEIDLPIFAASSEISTYYEVIDVNDSGINLLIKLNSEDGIKEVKYPNGNILNANDKTNVGIDFKVEKDNNYQFKIKSNDISEKILSINANEIYESIPTISIENLPTSALTHSQISATYKLTDNIEDNIIGIDLNKSKYIFTSSNTKYSMTDDIWNSANTFSSTEGNIYKTFENKEIGTQYLHILAVNKTGEGYSSYVSTPITVKRGPFYVFNEGPVEGYNWIRAKSISSGVTTNITNNYIYYSGCNASGGVSAYWTLSNLDLSDYNSIHMEVTTGNYHGTSWWNSNFGTQGLSLSYDKAGFTGSNVLIFTNTSKLNRVQFDTNLSEQARKTGVTLYLNFARWESACYVYKIWFD